MLNRVPSKSVSKISYEIWTGRKPALSHLRIWRCPAYVKVRSDRCNFIENPKKIKRYYFYLADEQKVFVSLRAVFLEKKFFGEGINASKIEFEKVQQVEPTQFSELIESDLTRSNPEPVVVAPLRRSNRVPHLSDRYFDF